MFLRAFRSKIFTFFLNEIRNFLVVFLGFSGIIGLFVNYGPFRRHPVIKIEPKNPIVMVDMKKFYESCKRNEFILPNYILEEFKECKLYPVGERKLIAQFFLEKYEKINNVTGDKRPQDSEWVDYEIKHGSFTYSFFADKGHAKLPREFYDMLVRSLLLIEDYRSGYEKKSVKTILKFDDRLFRDLDLLDSLLFRQFDALFSCDGISRIDKISEWHIMVRLNVDIFKLLSDKGNEVERIFLHRALGDSRKALSIFVIKNIGDLRAKNTKVIVNASHYKSVRVIDDLLPSQGMKLTIDKGTIKEIEIPFIEPKKDDKMIVIETNESYIDPEHITFESQSLEEINFDFLRVAFWIVTPLSLLISILRFLKYKSDKKAIM